MVNRVIAAPVEVVWRTFLAAIDEDYRLDVAVLEPVRSCRVGYAGHAADSSAPQRLYAFTPIDVGPHRGGTVVTAVDERTGLADRLFDLVAGGFVARTVEGAVRRELDALAAACTTRVVTRAA